MKHCLTSALIAIFILTSCQKEVITIGTNVSETFYIENNGAAMRVNVEGNTTGRVFIVFVPGGPGAGSFIYDTDYIRQNIGDRYAMVYWDERNSGASQGNSNAKDLTLEQMTDDLKKVLLVIKARYGGDCTLFLLGHSFGGLLTTSFLVAGDNQSMIKGWIFADASHNYPLNDSLTWQMLLTTGEQQIALNNNKAQWEEIVNYCNSHTGNFSLEESQQLEDYASDAESFFDGVPVLDIWTLIRHNSVRYDWPLTSMLVNYRYSLRAALNRDLLKTEFTSSLYKIELPVLILYGEYDFICPKEMGNDLFRRIGSKDKKIVISPVSGHSIMLQDEVLFCREVDSFVQAHK